ncbi:uncharacterized protein LOC122242336 [Penaeus japonicus]|uniref:uncharacterized protein LOC122242335 n=1 Tax=Penaeus japonicus TaxID=27405 RepID=UPI001C710E81|nr:uncharacterized protein LOC122242335 [Penaeus japonicus]XP_042855559.1 uncharacterized protein LOC122242336 [Penaeus japonicus]
MVMTKVLLLVLGVMVTGSLGSIFKEIEKPGGHPLYPGKCVGEGKTYGIGHFQTLPGCIKVECRRTDKGMSLVYSECPPLDLRTPCRQVNVPNGPFPDCCYRPERC